MLARRLLTSLIIMLSDFQSRTCYGLFFILEVVDEREDEVPDQANELNPVLKIHSRHLLPSREEADTSNCLLPQNIAHAQRIGNEVSLTP